VPNAEKHAPEQPLPLNDLENASEPDSALIELADDGFTVGGSSPNETSASIDDKTREPVEESPRQGQSKSRPKRPAREAARKTGRPSVPAWEEIMFGSRPGIDRPSS
jgi:hypothetical protein